MSTKSPTEFHRDWGNYPNAAQLPNVALSPTQDGALEVGDTAYVIGTSQRYYCTTATLGAAVWASGGGGGGGFEADFIDRYEYTQGQQPIEELVGNGMVDGNRVGGLTAYFWAMFDPTFSVAGNAQVKLYDVGPQAGPRAAGVLIATLQLVAGGLAYVEQALAVGGAPGANQIQNTPRMYEATVIQTSAPGDGVIVGCGGIAVR